MNFVKLSGNLVNDPDLRMIGANGTPKLSNKIAINEEYNGKKLTTYVPIEAWKDVAEQLSMYPKGNKVSVIGKIVTGSYEKADGTKVYTWGVNVNKIEVDDNKAKAINALIKDTKVVTDDELPF